MKKTLFIISLLLVCFTGFATVYPKPTTLDTYQDGEVGGNVLVGGDTILYDVGSHTGTQLFEGFIGTSEAIPIVIDLNGQSVDGQSNNIAMRIKDCAHVRVINGTIFGSSTQGFYAPQSWGISVDNITVYTCVGTAIRIGYQSLDDVPSLQRENFIDPYARVTNCTVYNITGSGEGIYMGASNPHWYNINADGTVYQYALLQEGTISGNTIYNVGFDGIQAGSCLDCEIFDNEIYDYGTLEDLSDQNGIQIGQGTNAIVYNNYIHDSGSTVEGYAIFMQGSSAWIYNNVIVHPYNGIHLGSGAYNGANSSIFCFANTITGVDGLIGININALFSRNLIIFNNINHHTTEPDDATSFYVDVTNLPENYLISHNLETYEGADAATTIFVSPGSENFDLIAGSPAIGIGRNLKWFNSGLLKDKSGARRQRSGAWDVGAFKY